MRRDSDRSPIARALLAGTVAVALCAALNAAAQSPAAESAANEAAPAAAAAEQPKSRRERRREAEAAEQAAAGAASPATRPTVAAAAEPPGETVEAKMVCKNIKVTGTKMARRVCGTPEQWAAVNDRTSNDAEETMRQVRERSSIVTSQPGTPGPGGFGSQ